MRKITLLLTMVIGLAVAGSARATLINITDGIGFSIAQDGSVSSLSVTLVTADKFGFTEFAQQTFRANSDINVFRHEQAQLVR